jgi:phosphate transport system substrate-binding protein
MKKYFVVMVVTLFVLSLVGTAMAKDLNWVGCGISKKAFMGAIAKAYEAKTGIKINLQGGGATRGIRDVAAGKADIGGSCRHVVRDAAEKNVRLVNVAWDALVVIVNPSNPVSDISSDDLKAVFEGRITNWKDLGGSDAQMKVVVRKGKQSGVGLMTRELLLKNPDQEYTSKAIALKSSGPVEKFVEKDSNAIAITGISSAKKRNIKMLAINGKEPSQENITTGAYVLYRPLYLVTSRTPSQNVRDFIKYVQSDEGQQIIAGEGTVNLKQGAALWKPYKDDMKKLRVQLEK